MSSSWSSDWLVAARTALVALRGQSGGDDAATDGLPLPALSVTDGISVLAQMTSSILSQLGRLATSGAMRADYVDINGVFLADQIAGMDPGSSITLREYLAAYPPPDAVGSPQKWLRSPTDYNAAADSGIVGDDAIRVAWATATTGGATGPSAAYTIYTTDKYDASGQLEQLRQLVDDYQHACDAIANGALTQADMASPMSTTAIAAFWHSIGSIAGDLDALSDVPPRPATEEVLQVALDDTARVIGETAGKIANIAGNVAGNAARGFTEGIGLSGVAFVVGVLVLLVMVR